MEMTTLEIIPTSKTHLNPKADYFLLYIPACIYIYARTWGHLKLTDRQWRPEVFSEHILQGSHIKLCGPRQIPVTLINDKPVIVIMELDNYVISIYSILT